MCYNNINSNNNNNNNNININNDKQIMSNNSDSNNIINSNSIKDNFRTPLTPLHRGGSRETLLLWSRETSHGGLGRPHMWDREKLHKCGRVEFYRKGLGGLHGFRLDRFCDNALRYAFSLIELSIVLIIIGLLVAGVTGGKSLIESAKTRALMNEIRGYKQAVNTYYATNGRLPGDKNNTGMIGSLSYADEGHRWHNCPVNALYDLNEEGIIDFDSKNSEVSNGGKQSNILNDTYYTYLFLEPFESSYSGVGTYCSGPIENYSCPDGVYSDLIGNFLKLSAKYFGIIPVKMAKSVDEKMDDGKHNSGLIRSINQYKPDMDIYVYEDGPVLSYDNAIKDKNYCSVEMIFKLDL